MQVKPGCPSCPIQRASENLSDCGAAPYLRFFLVRNEEAGGSNPLSSTRFQSTYIIFENRVNCRCTDLMSGFSVNQDVVSYLRPIQLEAPDSRSIAASTSETPAGIPASRPT